MTDRFTSPGQTANQPNPTQTLESFLKQNQPIFSPSNLHTLKQSTFPRNLKHWEGKKSSLHYGRLLRVGLSQSERHTHTYKQCSSFNLNDKLRRSSCILTDRTWYFIFQDISEESEEDMILMYALKYKWLASVQAVMCISNHQLNLINCAYMGTFVLNLIFYLISLIRSISENRTTVHFQPILGNKGKF